MSWKVGEGSQDCIDLHWLILWSWAWALDQNLICLVLWLDFGLITFQSDIKNQEVLEQKIIDAYVVESIRLDEPNEVIERHFCRGVDQRLLDQTDLESYLWWFRHSKLVQVYHKSFHGGMRVSLIWKNEGLKELDEKVLWIADNVWISLEDFIQVSTCDLRECKRILKSAHVFLVRERLEHIVVNFALEFQTVNRICFLIFLISFINWS